MMQLLRNLFSAVTPVMLLASVPVSAQVAGAPPAEAILKGARQVAVLQHQSLNGHIKKNGKKTQVALFLQGEDIQFQVADSEKRSWEKFHMKLGENQFNLYEFSGAKAKAFPSSKLSQPIRSSDLTYEDLAMRFLYWKNATVVDQEKVQGQSCWKLRLINPTKAGDYKIVYAWIHQKAGALMQVVGYNAAGKPLKRFQITKLMRVGDDYTLRTMRVDSIDPASNKSHGVTYLEFDKPKVIRPSGLR